MLHLATHSGTGERLVIDRPLGTGGDAVAARPSSMWRETVGGLPRFVPEAPAG